MISGSVRLDSAIPAEPPGAKRLAKRISDVSTEKPTPVGAAPKTAASIARKVYGFPPNLLNVKSMSLILSDPQPSYDAEIYTSDTTRPAPRLTGPIGLDRRYQKGEPTYIQWLGIDAVYAAKGAWLDDHTFVMNWLILGLGPVQRWTFTFEGDRLNVRVALPSGSEISIDSKTGG